MPSEIPVTLMDCSLQSQPPLLVHNPNGTDMEPLLSAVPPDVDYYCWLSKASELWLFFCIVV